MSIKALQEYTYVSKYARYNEKEKRRETWNEAVDRVKGMHIKRFPQITDDIEWAFDLVKQKRVLGSQRALQFGGKPIEQKEARMYNCIASYCDRIRFFQETFWLLLCGCGTGFSVQKHHIAKLPEFFEFRKNEGKVAKKKFIIPDSIEGWADALGILLATYLSNPEFKEWEFSDVLFDYSLIRPAGSALASGVGKAPGPEPLRRSLEIIRKLLDDRAKRFDRVRPIDAYDIVMHAADAVLSGGVRRSATLCMFSLADEEMLHAKTGNWFTENPQRARSNNSVVLLRNKTTKKQFVEIMSSVKEFGEPGFIFVDDLEALYNPCVEIGLYAYDSKGNSGWQACNLCEINGRKIKHKEDFALAAKAAAIIGTLQASYTNFTYLGPATKEIVEREALLGVSITGMMDNPGIIFDPDTQKEMAQLILKTNDEFAKKIGINPAARATCVKPAGTTSCILGSASGIHPHHAKRYFRRIQGNQMEAPLQFFKKYNPHAVEKSVWSANKTDEVAIFTVEVPDGAKVKNQLSAVELLEHVKHTQQNWVTYGKREGTSAQSWLTHNVSNTITILPDEWEGISDFIYENRKFFAGISLLPQSGDLDYPQAPFATVYTPREIVQMYGDGSLFASGLIVDGLRAFNDNLWAACDAVLGQGEPLNEPKPPLTRGKTAPDVVQDSNEWSEYKEAFTSWELKKDFVRRAVQFADRYFDGDIRRMSHSLKTVHNWKLWCDLQRQYTDIDYSLMREDTDETKPAQEWACSGGACELK